MSTNSPQTAVNTDALVKRYKDAYTVATVIISFGTALKWLGFLFGAVVFAAGFIMADEAAHKLAKDIATGYIIGGAVLGVFVWFIFYVAGVIASCQGQVLRANLDEAVYVCPFFTDANKIIAADLPTNRNA